MPKASSNSQAHADETWQQFVTEHMPLAALKPHPRNYQKHPQDEREHIMSSLKEHGFYRPVVIAREDTILAGHGVCEAARELGYTVVPVCRKDYDPMEPRALRLVIADNEIGHLAERDDRVLTELLKEQADDGNLLGTGYDEMMLANLLMVTRPSSEIEDLNAAAQWVGMPDYGEAEGQIQITVHFLNDDDRAAFCARLGLDTAMRRKSIWWPERDPHDVKSLKFTEGEGEGEGSDHE